MGEILLDQSSSEKGLNAGCV